LNDFMQKATTDLTNKLFGAATFLISLIVYLMTVQRTIPLWDCGEFIACSATLGIAHPPGTPLFLLIGRLATLVPLVSDISYRINLLSAFSAAAAATAGYVVAQRLLLYLPGVAEDSLKRMAAYSCSLIGALLFAFGRTQWSNAVEAEVYSLSMLLIFLLIWFSLRWYDCRGESGSIKYLILIGYLGSLSLSLHPTVFVVMPAIFLFMVFSDRDLLKDPRVWVSGIVIFWIMIDVTQYFTILAIWLVVSLGFYLVSRSRAWMLAFALAVASLAGFTMNAYIPIRAAQKPSINQNNPQTYDRFVRYLERKQYGQESMFTRMFHRRATWAHQMGDFPRIGFGGFLVGQYGMRGIFFIIPLVLAITAIIGLIKWKWKVGAYIALVLFIGTIGLVLYMNFADGSQIEALTGNDRLEVRDRDYFFTPGFILFGLCIGMGLFFMLNSLLARVGEAHKRLVTYSVCILGLLMPLAAVTANYTPNDRSDHYLAYDYAYSFLMSCPQDAIMFTNGDNDTFPVWCLQEAYGIRKDVRVANLSLIQTDWYQLQLKHEMGVPISLEDDQMEWEDVVEPRAEGGIIQRPHRKYVDYLRGGWEHYLMGFQDDSTRQVVGVADQMVENIITANRWKYPIVFANGYPTATRYALADHVRRRGLVEELVQEAGRGTWNEQVSMDLFANVFKYRPLNDPSSFRDEVATTLLIGCAQMMSDFSSYLERRGDTTKALQVATLMREQFPEFWYSYDKLPRYLNYTQAQKDSMDSEYFAFLDKLIATNPENYYYHQYKALTLQYAGKGEEAIAESEKAYKINPVLPITYRSLVEMYAVNGRRDDAIRVSREFLLTNPTDPTARAVAAGRF
jgi:tetratricopeptide (TPR) repeat protein